MSWEVRSMRSGTSFFNRAYSLHLLRRFWPLWALWLALLLLVPALTIAEDEEELDIEETIEEETGEEAPESGDRKSTL